MIGQFRIRRHLGNARKRDEVPMSYCEIPIGCNVKRLLNQDDTEAIPSEWKIQTFRTETLFGQPLHRKDYVLSYSRLKEFFGVRYGGFVDIWKYSNFNSRNPRSMKHFKDVNGGARDCLNFLVMRVNLTQRHTALCYYRPFTGTATIFEPQIMSEVIHRDYVELITRYHGPNVKIEYAQGFPHQDDDLICSFRALWACICVLANVDPTEYNINIVETFKFVKLLVECHKEVKKMSIRQILDRVATKK